MNLALYSFLWTGFIPHGLYLYFSCPYHFFNSGIVTCLCVSIKKSLLVSNTKSYRLTDRTIVKMLWSIRGIKVRLEGQKRTNSDKVCQNFKKMLLFGSR